MRPKDLLTIRLANQQLISKNFASVSDVVSWMGAIQSQDFAMAKWAIGLRLNDLTEEKVESAINSADIIRTHILRPTWHFVNAKDIRWMMSLTAPNIKKAMASQSKQIGLDDSIVRKCLRIIAGLLAHGECLTREEITTELAKKKIKLDNLQATNIMAYAEIDMVMCNGPRRGKQFTYALFDKKVPQANAMSREEALFNLARKYFYSHGPATIKDFSWWSGLSLTDAKLAVNNTQEMLEKCVVDGNEFWFKPPDKLSASQTMYLLPPYDEFTVGYANRDLVAGKTSADRDYFGSLIFKPLILSNGKAIGVWRRDLKKELSIVCELPDGISEPLKRKIRRSVGDYQEFVMKPLGNLEIR
jgi:hypothetical protein